MMKVIDLFCGAGGFSEGFKQAGFEIILGIDNDPIACKSFVANFPNANVVCADLTDIKKLPAADVIIGSPPCQEFSIANNSITHPNPYYIYYFLYLVNLYRPKFWVMEEVMQVKAYLPHNIHCQIISAESCGLQHRRKRLFAGRFPLILTPKTNKHNIIYGTPTTQCFCKKNKNLDFYTSFHRCHHRKPTMADVKRIMGFPDNYIFVGNKGEQSRQIGNTVCPPVAKKIALRILESSG
jgi:DNA (cytosine-5)-methyltransferase 1